MSAAKKAGVIYILTNPSFPDYVKIGYATNIENRLKQLNRSECIPFAFRVYATYDVSTPLQGPVHWLYQGRKLRDIRVDREEAGLYE